MREELPLRRYSLKTEDSYLRWVRQFYRYRHEAGLSGTVPDPTEVKSFLTHVALERTCAKSTQNQAFNALLFLFRYVLRVDVNDLAETPRAKRGRKLPLVLSPEEMLAVIEASDGERRLAIELIYGAGLRLQEFCRLRVKDIDFDMKTVRIISGKGDKDRTVMLPEHLPGRIPCSPQRSSRWTPREERCADSA